MADVAVSNITQTLLELRNDVYFLVGEDSDTFPEANVTRLINEGLNKVWRSAHRNLETIFAEIPADTFGTYIPDASLVDGSAAVDGVWITASDGSLTALSPSPFSNEDASAATGTPSSFAVVGRTLYLYPTPDVQYTVTVAYKREAPVLSNDADTTELSDLELSAAKYYAAWVLKIQDEEFESAERFKSLFDSTIADIIVYEAGVYPAGNVYQPSWSGGWML